MGRKECAAGFVYAMVTKLATCGCWLINNENSFYMHVIPYLDSFSLDVLELALELLPLAWACILLCYVLHIACCVTMGLYVTLLDVA